MRAGATAEGPPRGGTFVLTDRRLDSASGEAAFGFELDGETFEETARLPAGRAEVAPYALDLLLDVCHLAMGTSYYKLSAPRRLVFARPVSDAVAELARTLYDEGLREMAYRNGLGVPVRTEIVWRPAPGGQGAVATGLPGEGALRGHTTGSGLLAPVGGGKDSAAVLSLFPQVTGFAVSPTPAHERLAAAAGVPLLSAGRHLDCKLATLSSEPGALNGHIPVTAVNSALSAIAAATSGLGGVIMGNERSASEPTRYLGPVPVNHQYSKSIAFERRLAAVLAPTGTGYFSVLRQLSELAIAGIVATDAVLRRSFLSCNRAFRRARLPDEEQGWCLDCPKCHFTFLCFAVYLSPEEAVQVFGGNPLEEREHLGSFAALWDDLSKPFDCVGERAESAVAMAWLGDATGWQGTPVVKEMAGTAKSVAAAAGATMADLLSPQGEHLAPPALAERVAAAARAVEPRR